MTPSEAERIELPAGVVRALQASSTPEGVFTILAIDHRDSMRVLLNPDRPEDVPDATITGLKLSLLRAVGPAASAVMLDPEHSAGQAIVDGSLPGSIGFIVALEAQGYLTDPRSTPIEVLDGWSTGKAKRLGATGVKLLVPYNPHVDAERYDELIGEVVADCRRHELPLFLEPLPYPDEEGMPADEWAARRRTVVIDSARRLSALDPTVLKLPFPVDAGAQADEDLWQAACRELTDASTVPWALLSGGGPFERFARQVEVACRAGCSGFMAGRAVWGEVIGEDHPDTVAARIALPRFARLAEIARTFGRGWHAVYRGPTIDRGWYRTY